jgi:hypothetical protein
MADNYLPYNERWELNRIRRRWFASGLLLGYVIAFGAVLLDGWWLPS